MADNPKRRVLLNFSDTILALEGVLLRQKPPAGGYIKEIVIHWPPGCIALVDVAVLHGSVQVCPEIGYIALDDATITYIFNERIEYDEEIVVDIQNTDGDNPHTITVSVNIEKDPD